MIIGTREAIHDLEHFKAGLDAAAQAVVRISVHSGRQASAGGFATGWLITETLVITPAFVIGGQEGESYTCEQGSRSVAATVELGAIDDPTATAPALLRLAEPLGRPLTLAGDAAEPGDEVCLLQHPDGDARLHLSFGRITTVGDPTISYDADTRGGSSGAPVLDGSWAVVAMHTGRVLDASANQGATMSALLPRLRESPAWPEIAELHKLADAGAIQRALEEPTSGSAPPADGTADLLPAAVRWSFDPKTLPAAAVEQLRPLVAEPSAARWTLPAGARATLLRSAGSLEALRAARGSGDSSHPGQQVIDRILAGPPYSLDEVTEQALPYWLQATRWFAGLVESLPTPGDVIRTLERRRIRSRLEQIGGPGFRGRAEELQELREWHRDDSAGPMVVTGIGGVGKSSLVAHFALELPQTALQLWLDFDRADVAPDDAVSVLRLLFDQLGTQLEGFAAPALDSASWDEAVAALGPALAPHMNGAPAPLLVLDGFEVAQHFKEHREIWRLLEELLPQVPGMRVLVSGRAPVGDVQLGGRGVHGLHLAGLAEPDAAAWLRDAGIGDEEVIERVVEITHGVPLALRLAVRWAEAGGEVRELPDELPERLVDGFLYERILDRVIDPLLKPVAQDALVLRRVTPEMIPVVLRDSLPAGLEPEEVFERLAQEMALVGDDAGAESLAVAVAGSGVLRLRPEVRSATLRLLETDRAHRVRKIDERAANWYARQDQRDVANAAELVYHRLRLGDIDGAERAWRDGCAPLLLYADEELPVHLDAAREWLRERTHAAPTAGEAHAAWEREALDRIRALIARGVVQAIGPLLEERDERGGDSPLVLYDAWLRWATGDSPGARETLAEAGAGEGVVARDRAVLAAWLASEAGDRDEADRQLVEVADPAVWTERPDPPLDVLVVEAARVRLWIDVGREVELIPHASAVSAVLSPTDVVVPALAKALGGAAFELTRSALHVPRDRDALSEFAAELDRLRTADPRPLRVTDQTIDLDEWREVGLRLVPPDLAPAVDLAYMAFRRWLLVTRSLFLAQACDELQRLKGLDLQRLAIAGTLAAFATSPEAGVPLVYESIPLERLLLGSDAPYAIRDLPPRAGYPQPVLDELMRGSELLSMFLLSPDPLEQLLRAVVGIPHHLPLRGQA